MTTHMSKKGESQTAIALLPNCLGATFLDLITNGLGNALGIDAEADSIEEILPHRGMDNMERGSLKTVLRLAFRWTKSRARPGSFSPICSTDCK